MSRLWPRYAGLDDLAVVEEVPLEARGLPDSTYALLRRAATLWPDRTAVTVLPDAARWREPLRRTYAELLADVHRYANLLHRLGVRRGDAVALMAPNCAELIPATLAAQLAGIAAPLNGALSPKHLAALLRRSSARVLIAAGPEPAHWASIHDLAGQLDAILVLRPTAAADAPEPLPAVDGVLIGHLTDLDRAVYPLADEIGGTVVQQPFEFGYQSMTDMIKYKNGDKSFIPANKQIIIPTRIIDKSNVADFQKQMKTLLAK